MNSSNCKGYSTMIKGAVIGNPILFSLSPQVYKNLFKISGLNGHYTRLSSDNIHDAFKLSKRLKLDFMNITSPFKSQYFELPDITHSEEVNKLKSANSIIFDDINKAFNTDVYALLHIIDTFNLSNNAKALVLGGGDTGTMCCKTLSSRFNRIDLLSRRDFLFESSLNKHLKNKNVILKNRYDLIINTHKNCHFDFDNDFFRHSVVIDAIYNKPWLLNFESKTYISGLKWLELQALKTFTNLTGLELNEMNRIDLERNNLNLIFLIGFMGAGKTTIGRDLAIDIGYGFVDTDELIHLKTGMTIKQIFEQLGEQFFRDIEFKTLNECMHLSNYVVATGGGIIDHIENLDVLKHGTVIWLYESFNVLMGRIKDIDRPLLNNAEQLFHERFNKYFSASDLIIYNQDYNKTLKLLKYEISSAI